MSKTSIASILQLTLGVGVAGLEHWRSCEHLSFSHPLRFVFERIFFPSAIFPKIRGDIRLGGALVYALNNVTVMIFTYPWVFPSFSFLHFSPAAHRAFSSILLDPRGLRSYFPHCFCFYPSQHRRIIISHFILVNACSVFVFHRSLFENSAFPALRCFGCFDGFGVYFLHLLAFHFHLH